MQMGTAMGDFDMHMLVFARGRVAATLFVMGLSQVHLEDIIPLARLIDTRIQEYSP
jgi:hypothetical protein